MNGEQGPQKLIKIMLPWLQSNYVIADITPGVFTLICDMSVSQTFIETNHL